MIFGAGEMYVVIGLALGLIVVGLIMTALSGNLKYPLLISITFWVGLALVVIGLVLLLTPVLIWINNQLRSMLGQP